MYPEAARPEPSSKHTFTDVPTPKRSNNSALICATSSVRHSFHRVLAVLHFLFPAAAGWSCSFSHNQNHKRSELCLRWLKPSSSCPRMDGAVRHPPPVYPSTGLSVHTCRSLVSGRYSQLSYEYLYRLSSTSQVGFLKARLSFPKIYIAATAAYTSTLNVATPRFANRTVVSPLP